MKINNLNLCTLLNFVTNLDSIIVNNENVSQMKHQLDAKLCRFYFFRVTLHVSGASVHKYS